MWHARTKSLLQLHLPEGWPGAAATCTEFRYARFEGGACATGVAPLDAVPKATRTIVVAPASAVLFVRVCLPRVRAGKQAQLLPLAVEDAIATSPEEVHVVLVEHVPAGASLVAVVNRVWLSQVIGELAAQGIRPARLLVETELAEQLRAAESTHVWLVVRAASGGFACLGGGETVALDLGEGSGSVPLALRLARNTHRRAGETPSGILVFTAPEAHALDVDAWASALFVPVRSGGEWRPELIDGRARRETDLLRGDFRPAWNGRNQGRALKAAGVAAVAVLGLHTALGVADWWRVSTEAREIKIQMETQFRQIFPDAAVVVDAPLQMRRNLAKLRREAGVPDASDFMPLLAAVGPPLAAAGVHAERMRYDARGGLELEVVLPINAGPEELEKRLVLPGYRVRIEPKAGAATKDAVVLHISAEA